MVDKTKNKGKMNLMKRLFILKNGRLPTTEATEESAAVRGLKKQIRILEEINDTQAGLLSDMGKQLKLNNESSMQDKLLNAAIGIFAPKQAPQPANPQRILESGAPLNVPSELSDEQINGILANYDRKTIKSALILGDNFLKKKIREHYPEISENSLERGLEIARSL